MHRLVSPRLVPLLLVAILAGCAARPELGPPAAARGDLLFLGAGAAIRAVEPATGAPRFQIEAAQPLPDWSALVVSAPSGRLTVLDGATGTERFSRPVGGGLAVRAVSSDGRRAALMEQAGGPAPYVPPGREHTSVWIADLDAAAPRKIELTGNFEPEAFSADRSTLFALEWLPARTPDRYRVRRIDVATGNVDAVFTREKVPNAEEMRGEGRQQVLAPDRQTLYTLYTAQPDHVHARDMLRRANGQPTPMVHAFVHTLGLDWGWTYCIDLPAPFGLGPPSAHTIAVSPGGGARLYVADLSSGTVAAIRTLDLQVDRVATLDADPAIGQGSASAVVGPDGTLYLAGRSAVLVLDGSTLTVKARYSLKAPSAGLGLSEDGHRLYVGQPNGVLVLGTRDGRWLGSVPTAPFDLVRHVGVLAVP